MWDAEVVADASDDEVDEVADTGWFLVETGHGWQNGGSCPTDSHHVLQLDQSERGFAGYEYEGATFLEVDIGGALDQVGRIAAGDG